MSAPGDPLAWLMPDSSEHTRAQARRVTTFLRLLASDARERRGEAVGIGVGHVQAELERLGRERRSALATVLLRQHIAALASRDSFLAPPRAPRENGEPRATLAALVQELRLADQEVPWREPHADAGERASALVRFLRAELGPAAAAPRVLDAYLVHALHGPRAGERAWRLLMRAASGTGAAGAVRALAVEGVAAALLDQGRVRAARAWLDAHAARAEPSSALARLARWARALAEGDTALAGAAAELPGPLAELLERRSAAPPSVSAARAASGSRSAALARPSSELAPDTIRAETGATLFVAFALEGDGVAPFLWDVAPRWRGAFEAWWRARRRLHADPSSAEHAVAGAGERVELDRALLAPPGQGVRGALAASTRALALEPLRADDGRVLGWVHLEYEHHLLPARSRRLALARAIAPALERAASPGCPGAGALAELAHALAAAGGPGVARRRWWTFDESREVVASGGGALGLGPAGGAGAVGEVLECGASVHLAGEARSRACHARAAWGVALPLSFAGRVHGVLAVEGERRGQARLVARLAQATRAFGAPWRAAQFAGWHAQRFGRAVSFRLDPGGWRDGLARLALGARRGRTTAVVGTSGVGRVIVARWLHFEGPGPAAPLFDARGASAAELLARAAAADEPLGVLLDAAALTAPVRLAWAARQRAERARHPLPGRRSERPRRSLLVLLASERDPLGPLGERFVRQRVVVPPLAERRDELPGLLALALRGRALTPAAEALLWRQPWRGNLPELATFALALLRRREGSSGERGRPLGAQEVRGAAAELGLTLVERIGLRPVDRNALAAARRLATRPDGSWNRRHTALLLGWDPATLAHHA